MSKLFYDWHKEKYGHCFLSEHGATERYEGWHAARDQFAKELMDIIYEQRGYDHVEDTMIIDAKELVEEVRRRFEVKE